MNRGPSESTCMKHLETEMSNKGRIGMELQDLAKHRKTRLELVESLMSHCEMKGRRRLFLISDHVITELSTLHTS